ncbi:MAG: hypothetical protein OXU29_04745 [Gammaproteobacteria bacterium]|nr:hypothetical protein [Gammaproteobacteria bacterium]
MKLRIFPALTLTAALLLAGVVQAQIVIEESDGGGGRGLSDNFFGEVGFTGAAGSSHQRTFGSVEIGYDGTFADDRGRVFLSAIASNSDIELDLELKSSARDNTDAPREMTLKEDDTDLDLGDAYVQYEAPGNFVFTAGRARVSWGQFNLVSPVNLALPVTPQSNEASVRKVNLLVPQDQVSFSWFPHERVEFQGYHFFSTNIDSLVEEVTRNRGSDEVYAMGADASSESMSMPTDRRDLTRHSHNAARLLFYPDWGTLGFTWHKGRKALAFSSNLATLENPGGDTDVFNVRRHVDFPEADNFGFELAIPAGQWTWKFEMLRQETQVDLNGYSIAFDSRPPMAGTLRGHYDYFTAVIEDNAGKLYIPVDRYIFGIGAESDRDNWRFDLNLFVIDDRFDSTGDELIRLEEAAGFETDRDTLVFPAISVARYIGGNKEREAGVLAGFLGAYFGVSTYYTSKIGDNFRWTAGVEAASSLRDQFLSEREDRYELADDLSAGFRLSVIYNF